jgi:hypothetical protein
MQLKKRLLIVLLSIFIEGMAHPVPHIHPHYESPPLIDRRRHRVLVSR